MLAHAHIHTHTEDSGEGFILKLVGLRDPNKLIAAIACLISLITKETFRTSPITVNCSHSELRHKDSSRTQVTCDVTDPVGM